MSEQTQIDSVFKAVENPVRRKSIRRLSHEPSYPLEMAKEIGEAQQLVTSHLAILEKAGLVGSDVSASPVGPKRKLFFLKQSASLSLSFGPHLYNEQFLSFEALPAELSKQATDFMKRLSEIERGTKESKIKPFSCLLEDIDSKIDELDAEKAVLLFIRNLAMKFASEEFENHQKTHEERRILHYILDERTKDIESISEALNLKESLVRAILEKIRKEIP